MNEVKYNVLDLFAGIGGAAYAGKLVGNWHTVGYVENDPYCQRVIQARIQDGIFDDAPIWSDIRTFKGSAWRGYVDLITAGFPCQPFSVAGKRKGADDERNMWPETLRVIGEVRPRFAFLENVPGLITSGYFGTILGDLSEIGYDCRWTIISAADVGAPHLRKRLWILAYPSGCRFPQRPARTGRSARTESDNGSPGRCETQNPDHHEPGQIRWWDIDPADIPDTEGSERSRGNGTQGNGGRSPEPGRQNKGNDPGRITSGNGTNRGDAQSFVGRVAHGVPDRCNRLKGLGNAWVPLVAATAWRILTAQHA